MEKTFTYKFETRQYGDEYDYDEFEYTPKEDNLKLAIVNELFDSYFRKEERELFSLNQKLIIKNALKNFTDDNDNWENLAKDFEKELKEYFEEDALAEYKYRG